MSAANPGAVLVSLIMWLVILGGIFLIFMFGIILMSHHRASILSKEVKDVPNATFQLDMKEIDMLYKNDEKTGSDSGDGIQSDRNLFAGNCTTDKDWDLREKKPLIPAKDVVASNWHKLENGEYIYLVKGVAESFSIIDEAAKTKGSDFIRKPHVSAASYLWWVSRQPGVIMDRWEIMDYLDLYHKSRFGNEKSISVEYKDYQRVIDLATSLAEAIRNA